MMDPDNRRAVDHDRNAALLDEVMQHMPDRNSWLRQQREDWQDGRLKMWLTCRLLQLRKRHPDLFGSSDYQPLTAEGPRSDDLCSYLRRVAGDLLLVVVSRFPSRRQASWVGTTLPIPDFVPGELMDALTGGKISHRGALELDRLMAILPVAVLVSSTGGLES